MNVCVVRCGIALVRFAPGKRKLMDVEQAQLRKKIDRFHCVGCGTILSSEELGDLSNVCSGCMDMSHRIFAVLNYFLIPIFATHPRGGVFMKTLEAGAAKSGRGRDAALPDVLDPGLYHGQACRQFPIWDAIVPEVKEFLHIKHWNIDGFLKMLDCLRQLGYDDNQIVQLPLQDLYKLFVNLNRNTEESRSIVENLLSGTFTPSKAEDKDVIIERIAAVSNRSS